jgi:hypothetical protein
MAKFSRSQKNEIVSRVFEKMQAEGHRFPLRRACLHFAAATAIAISQRGVRPVLQAGSASWPFKSKECDDGGPTNYTYHFDPSEPLSAMRMQEGGMPEIHVWCGIPTTGELVDLTTGFLPDLLAESLPAEKWTAPPPPAFFWGTNADFPKGWRYEATLPAILLAFQFLQEGNAPLYDELQRRGLTPPPK